MHDEQLLIRVLIIFEFQYQHAKSCWQLMLINIIFCLKLGLILFHLSDSYEDDILEISINRPYS